MLGFRSQADLALFPCFATCKLCFLGKVLKQFGTSFPFLSHGTLMISTLLATGYL